MTFAANCKTAAAMNTSNDLSAKLLGVVKAPWGNLLDIVVHSLEGTEDTQKQQQRAPGAGGQSSEDKLKIISANIHSLRPRANVIPTWEADVIALQETKLAPHAIAETSAVLNRNGYSILKPSRAK